MIVQRSVGNRRQNGKSKLIAVAIILDNCKQTQNAKVQNSGIILRFNTKYQYSPQGDDRMCRGGNAVAVLRPGAWCAAAYPRRNGDTNCLWLRISDVHGNGVSRPGGNAC